MLMSVRYKLGVSQNGPAARYLTSNQIGLARFAADCEDLANRHGDRFKLPAATMARVAAGVAFYQD
jgi:hypothetical protein